MIKTTFANGTNPFFYIEPAVLQQHQRQAWGKGCEQVYALICAHPGVTIRQLAIATGRYPASIDRSTRSLVKIGKVRVEMSRRSSTDPTPMCKFWSVQ